MAKSRSAFTTVRSEGGLLPADLLTRIVSGETSGLDPERDYHLPPNERLNEAVSRSWNRLVGAWASFKDARARLPADAPATTETRERWLLVLFSELGFGRLQPARAVEIDGRSFPVSHGWNAVPIHLVGAGLSLDRRAPRQAGAARTSPHGLLQELLNAAPEHLWGIVSNGLQLRLLRDNVAMTRQAYLEFDLEEMMDGQVYSDFVLLWLVAHESRFEGEQPADCWLERWSKEAQQAGVRALDHLREGVERAIEALGRGFIAHRDNGPLRERLRSGDLDAQECYRQLLRVVYRLIFLFVAEDRGLLMSPDASLAARDVYVRHYSLGRLRRLAERRRGATQHGDLWRALSLVMNALGTENGCPPLGLPALGSFLWSAEATTAFAGCELANRDLLRAVAALAFVTAGKVPRQVDYRNLGPEELGSVYESLLERHPRIDLGAGTFELATVSGNERKTTGSYYTPTSLIACLLDSALDPVLDEAARQPDPEAAILGLRVVDPACGSGHFLIAAAHRIARRLAAVRSGEEEPSPDEVRRALRQVIGRCVYGVDVNPMAVELCKVSLWIEALDPGRPLSFLDQHVQCGHSLIGATPELLDAGIPDTAFKPIEGDDKAFVASLRKRNRQERDGGQISMLFGGEDSGERLRAPLVDGLTALDQLGDDTIAGLRAKERRYAELVESSEARRAKLAADAWCAAFVAPKRPGEPAITEEVRLRLAADPTTVPDATIERMGKLEADYRFFHWHLAFAQVFDGKRGFDVVLGNPPWEQSQFHELEFFAARDSDIAGASGVTRKRMISELAETNPRLDQEYHSALRQTEAVTHFLRDSGRFPLCGQGRLNTYAVFAETMRMLTSAIGRAGIIVPTGIATDDTTKEFFSALVGDRSLVSLYDFENAAPIFPGVHRSYKFCLVTLIGANRQVRSSTFAFFMQGIEELLDQERCFELTTADFELLNPNTRTCPIFRNRRDAKIVLGVYSKLPILINRTRPADGSWQVSLRRMFNMTDDSGLFRTGHQLEDANWHLDGNWFYRDNARYLPLYEGKMFHQFDHRYATYGGNEPRMLSSTEKQSVNSLSVPHYWIPERSVDDKLKSPPGVCSWLLPWRTTARSTDERTLIMTALPKVALNHKAPMLIPADTAVLALDLMASLNSFVVDFIARTKVGGTELSHFVIQQIPVLPRSTFTSPTPWCSTVLLAQWIAARAAELCCTAIDIQPLAEELGYPYAPFRWDDTRRELIRAELDAAFFHLYDLPRDDVDYVMDTFPIVRRKDERAHGEYRTKRLILERYDALGAAVASSVPYETVLDPPPAHPSVAHGALG